MTIDELRALWRRRRGGAAPEGLSKDLIARALAYWLQEAREGGLDPLVRKRLGAATKSGQLSRYLRVGTVIVREYRGRLHEVTVAPTGFLWNGQIYASLSMIAKTITGTAWNGHRFFGLRGEAAGITTPEATKLIKQAKAIPAPRCGPAAREPALAARIDASEETQIAAADLDGHVLASTEGIGR